MPTQRLELRPDDAETLGLAARAIPVTVSVDGDSVEACVAVKGRMRPGGAFLIEGTSAQNGNVLASGEPRRIEVTKREVPAERGSSRERQRAGEGRRDADADRRSPELRLCA